MMIAAQFSKLQNYMPEVLQPRWHSEGNPLSRRDEAEKLAAASGYANENALIFAGLGDKEGTFEALDQMAMLGPERIGTYLNIPELDLLRGDPRLKAFRKRVGLPD